MVSYHAVSFLDFLSLYYPIEEKLSKVSVEYKQGWILDLDNHTETIRSQSGDSLEISRIQSGDSPEIHWRLFGCQPDTIRSKPGEFLVIL